MRAAALLQIREAHIRTRVLLDERQQRRLGEYGRPGNAQARHRKRHSGSGFAARDAAGCSTCRDGLFCGGTSGRFCSISRIVVPMSGGITCARARTAAQRKRLPPPAWWPAASREVSRRHWSRAPAGSRMPEPSTVSEGLPSSITRRQPGTRFTCSDWRKFCWAPQSVSCVPPASSSAHALSFCAALASAPT